MQQVAGCNEENDNNCAVRMEGKDDGAVARKCRDCAYSCMVNVGEEREMMRACVYILHTGSKRPCPASDDCTVYRPVRARR